MKKNFSLTFFVLVIAVIVIGSVMLLRNQPDTRFLPGGETVNTASSSPLQVATSSDSGASAEIVPDTTVTLERKDIAVNWFPEAKEIPNPAIFRGQSSVGGESSAAGQHYYLSGKVRADSAFMPGADVITYTYPPDGPGGDQLMHFLRLGDKVVVELPYPSDTTSLSEVPKTQDVGLSYYNSLKAFYRDGVSFDYLFFPDLFFPLTIKNDKGTFGLSPYGNMNAAMFDPSIYQVAFTGSAYGTAYMDSPETAAHVTFPQNGFYFRAPDGSSRQYGLMFDGFVNDQGIPQVTWLDGTKNTVQYLFADRGGCGAKNFASVPKGVTAADLIVAGKTSTGEYVYAFSDQNNQILKDIYENEYNPQPIYDQSTQQAIPQTKKTYAEFSAEHPVFFYQDSFGRYIKFQNAEFMLQAECGKPVIYLYPQKDMDVSVQVKPRGGMTESIPAYGPENGTGWKVRATTESKITDLTPGASFGQTFPYLFWEGRGGLYQTPEKGFVIASDGVHPFLEEKLAALGLSKKERGDFEDFWEPKMAESKTGMPYLFVTFLGTEDMNRLAPLSIVPAPDTVIRILMDFKPLPKPIPVQGYAIHTPERTGFTVVEWGGVLR